jgi:hypothetical protein
MGSIISAINDDMDKYKWLCGRYSEQPQYTKDAYGNLLLDCYGEHAQKLENKLRKEQKKP